MATSRTNEGRGLITTGLWEWDDYAINARIRQSLMKSGGLAVCVQGLDESVQEMLIQTSGD
jgi:hypothetical protein